MQLGEYLSHSINVSSSVVQGSHLGPILFSLFINDINEIFFDIDFAIYADDIKIWKEINSTEDAFVLQENISALAKYLEINQLSLNAKKCFVTTFTKNKKHVHHHNYNVKGTQLIKKSEMRDLGVVYDGKLKFSEHINTVCSKARRMLGFIARVGKYFRNPLTFKILYNSLVRSNLEYASVIWNPHTITLTRKLETVQHKFLRLVGGKCFNISRDNINYSVLEQRLNLVTLEQRRRITDIKFIIKSFHNEIDSQTYINHFKPLRSSSTRNQKAFNIIKSKTDTGLHSIFNRLMSTYNGLCSDNAWLTHRPTDELIRKMIAQQHQIIS